MIDSGSKENNCEKFRAALSLCREALTAEDLLHLWKEIIEEWLPSSPKFVPGRDYLQKNFWPIRSKWSLTFSEMNLLSGLAQCKVQKAQIAWF